MKMESTCRLCLSESPDALEDLWEGCDVLDKLSTSLFHHITLIEDLPRKICHQCVQTVNYIHSFYQRISRNESMLQKRFNESMDSINEDNNSNGHDQLILHETFKSDDPADVEMTVKTVYKGNDSISNIRTQSEKENVCNSRTDSKSIKKESETVNIKIVKRKKKNITEMGQEERIGNQSLELNHEIEISLDPGDDVPLSVLKENKMKITDFNVNNLTNKFKCLTCFEVFSNQLELLRHYRHIELEKFNKNNDSLNTDIKPIKYKMLTETDGSVIYKCERCYKKYKLKKYIDRHIKSHIERRPFLCKLCGKTYQTASIIVAHGKMHSGQMYMCAYQCGYRSVHKHVVMDHEKRHRKEYKYKCETCGKGFQVRTSYQQHQNIHNDVKPFQCDQCEKTFHLHKYLMTHKSSVHPQSSRRKPWVCKHCGMPCDSKHSLNLHLKQGHGIVTTKPSLCDICGKVVRDKYQLRQHKRAVHLKIRPYTCGFCDKSFQKKYTLKVHEQTHTGKRYRCGVCDRLFTRNDTLARHLNNCHTDSKNKCQKCDKTFPTKLKLAAHQKICTSFSREDSQTQ
ncbi:zinc finger protein 383-like [Maniola hyperantus]|uniref:zinc finger protein 383-like n=1 Tax=Aphantopus hyperantus TaxID=2795564 RepID=UPI001568EC58|nr:zinc finger protein 2-like [Maniola hyperantus]